MPDEQHTAAFLAAVRLADVGGGIGRRHRDPLVPDSEPASGARWRSELDPRFRVDDVDVPADRAQQHEAHHAAPLNSAARRIFSSFPLRAHRKQRRITHGGHPQWQVP